MNSDVLVVGGGPAGTSVAITCARAGQAVILVEAETFPRHVPGETLHPGVESLLRRLGVASRMENANFLRHAGVWIDRWGKPEFHSYGSDEHGPWLGYQAIRAEFDALLLAQARCSGVRILQPHRALRVLREGNRIVGAETTAGTVRATFTVDASGSFAWLARQLSLPFCRTSCKLIAFYGYMRGDCSEREAEPCFTHRRGGWVWTARVRPNLFHWTRLFETWPPHRREGPPAEFAGLEPVGRPKGCDVTWRLRESAAGPGYFLAGDAASVSDPSSSHGVLRALMSGMLAGHMILRKGYGSAPESMLALEYRQFLSSSFEFDLAQASRLIRFDLNQNGVEVNKRNAFRSKLSSLR